MPFSEGTIGNMAMNDVSNTRKPFGKYIFYFGVTLYFLYVLIYSFISSAIKTKVLKGSNIVMPAVYHALPHGVLRNGSVAVETINTNTTFNYTQEFRNSSNASTINTIVITQKPFYNVTYTNRKRLMSLNLTPGRVGNQMFQVATLLGIASKHGYTPVINPEIPLAKIFLLPYMVNTDVKNSTLFQERVCCEFKQSANNLSHATNWTIQGYLQSWRYFSDHEGIVRKAFTFRESYTRTVQNYISNISKTNVANVGIHVRRGDFADKGKQDLGYSTAPISYFNNSMAYFENTVGKVQFIVLSDNITWCKQNLNRSNVLFSPFTDPGMDMALMSSCDHMIITSGSFGWWGAWMAGGKVVYYRGFPVNGTWLDTQFNLPDYYPDKWIGML